MCNAPGCRRDTPIQEWIVANHLEENPRETVKQHALRCLAFMASLHSGGEDAIGPVVREIAQVAGVEPAELDAAVASYTPPEVLDWLESVPAMPEQDHKECDIPEV